MAEVTTALIKELRELTGAGILACKNALVETDGDMDAAVEILRKKGEAQAVKKASRIAAEGIVRVVVRDNTAVMVEVNSETDFVAKNEKFQNFVDAVVESIFACDAEDVDALLNEKFAGDPSKTVGEALVRNGVIQDLMVFRRGVLRAAAARKSLVIGSALDIVREGRRILFVIRVEAGAQIPGIAQLLPLHAPVSEKRQDIQLLAVPVEVPDVELDPVFHLIPGIVPVGKDG